MESERELSQLLIADVISKGLSEFKENAPASAEMVDGYLNSLGGLNHEINAKLLCGGIDIRTASESESDIIIQRKLSASFVSAVVNRGLSDVKQTSVIYEPSQIHSEYNDCKGFGLEQKHDADCDWIEHSPENDIVEAGTSVYVEDMVISTAKNIATDCNPYKVTGLEQGEDYNYETTDWTDHFPVDDEIDAHGREFTKSHNSCFGIHRKFSEVFISDLFAKGLLENTAPERIEEDYADDEQPATLPREYITDCFESKDIEPATFGVTEKEEDKGIALTEELVGHDRIVIQRKVSKSFVSGVLAMSTLPSSPDINGDEVDVTLEDYEGNCEDDYSIVQEDGTGYPFEGDNPSPVRSGQEGKIQRNLSEAFVSQVLSEHIFSDAPTIIEATQETGEDDSLCVNDDMKPRQNIIYKDTDHSSPAHCHAVAEYLDKSVMSVFLSDYNALEEILMIEKEKSARLLRQKRNAIREEGMVSQQRWQAKLEDLNLKLSDSKQCVKMKDNEMAGLKATISRLTEQLAEMQRVTELERKDAESKFREVSGRMEEIRQQTDLFQRNSDEKDALNSALMKELVTAEKKHQQMIEKYEQEKERTRLDTLAAIPVVLDGCTQTDPDMETMRNRVRITELEQSLAVKEEELNETMEEMNNLTYQMDDVHAQVDEEKEAHEITRTKLADEKAGAVSLQDKNQLLELKLKAANYEIDRISEEIGSLQTLNKSLHNEAGDIDDQVKQLKMELDSLRKDALDCDTTIAQLRRLNTEFSDNVAEVTADREILLLKLDYFKSIKCTCGKLFPDPEGLPKSGTPEDYIPTVGELMFEDDPDDASHIDGVTVGVNGVRALRDHSASQGSPRLDAESFIVGACEANKVEAVATPNRKATRRLTSPSREDNSLLLPPPICMEEGPRSPQMKGKPKQSRLKCSECMRKFKGDGRKLPSDLHTRNPKSPTLSPQMAELTSPAYANAGYPEPTQGYLDSQAVTRDKYGHRRGEECVFCSWKCARRWNQKHTPVILKYRTAQLIDIAEGAYA